MEAGQPCIFDTVVRWADRAYVEVDIVHTKSLKRLLQPFFDIGMMRVPEFGCQKYLLPRDTAVFDALADLVFIAWEA